MNMANYVLVPYYFVLIRLFDELSNGFQYIMTLSKQCRTVAVVNILNIIEIFVTFCYCTITMSIPRAVKRKYEDE